MARKTRTVYRKTSTQEWEEVKMKDLQVGDEVRLYEADGTEVKHDRKAIFIVTSEPKQVDVEGYKMKVWAAEMETKR